MVLGFYAVPLQFGVPLFQRLEATSYDLRLILESRVRPMPQAPGIVLIEIDDNSLAQYGRWPWPRQIWADVVDALVDLGAAAIFFDVVFPDAVDETVRTRSGRQTFREALEASIRFVEAGVQVRSTGATPLSTAVKSGLDEGFANLRADVRSILPAPDAALAAALKQATRSGLITGGAVSILQDGSFARDPVKLARVEAYRRIAARPQLPVESLPGELWAMLAAERVHLELHRQACLLYAENVSPDLDAPGVTAELREHATAKMHIIRRQVMEARVRAELGLTRLELVNVAELHRRASPGGYQNTKMSSSIVEQTLSELLLRRDHLLRPRGRQHLPNMPVAPALSLPSFTIARAYGFMGADTEIKDSDGFFRSVPLLWEHHDGAVPAAGLALYLRLMAGAGSPRLPDVKLEAGPMLAIERVRAGGQPTGVPPLRVPLSSAGQLMVHWAGRYVPTFAHVPAANLLLYAGTLNDRADYFRELVKSHDYQTVIRLRDEARDLDLIAPEAPVALEKLIEIVRSRYSTGFTEDWIYLTSKLADKPGSSKEARLPHQWHRFLSALQREIETSRTAALKTMFSMIAAEKDPAKRAEKQQKYASRLEPYDRNVRRVESLRAELSPRLRGKVCIIGHTATSSTDLAPMPFERQYPKVGSYANVLNTLLTERFLYRPGWLAWGLGGLVDPGYLQLPLVVAVCLAFAFVLPGLTSLRGLVWAMLFSAVWAVAASALLILSGIWIDMVAPIMGAGLTYVFVVTARNRRTETVRSMFETYVDPRIVKVMVEDESRWRELGGHESRITAFFSDIANFTSLSEMLTPQEVSQMLTDYLSPMTDIILAHDGTRDKYIGDAIVAFFGAPVPIEGHELQACLASIEQQSRLIELKKRWRADRVSWYAKLLEAGTDLAFRIGLNSGQAKVGNFGSLTSKNYTMIGDSVNLASRLEGANKEYGTLIMASEATVEPYRSRLVTRELDRLIVKGRKEAVRVYEVVGRAGHVAAYWPELLELYERGLGEYHGRDFGRARNIFMHLHDKWPHDGPTLVYVHRCEAFLLEPPVEDWDGSFRMLHK